MKAAVWGGRGKSNICSGLCHDSPNSQDSLNLISMLSTEMSYFILCYSV
jgi:hypothetical protein